MAWREGARATDDAKCAYPVHVYAIVCDCAAAWTRETALRWNMVHISLHDAYDDATGTTAVYSASGEIARIAQQMIA